jgi:hypothetical protein
VTSSNTFDFVQRQRVCKDCDYQDDVHRDTAGDMGEVLQTTENLGGKMKKSESYKSWSAMDASKHGVLQESAFSAGWDAATKRCIPYPQDHVHH